MQEELLSFYQGIYFSLNFRTKDREAYGRKRLSLPDDNKKLAPLG